MINIEKKEKKDYQLIKVKCQLIEVMLTLLHLGKKNTHSWR